VSNNQTMRVLVLGGTRFVGRAIASAAIEAGWDVTTFNRGRSGRSVNGTSTIHGDRTDPTGLAQLVDAGPWDVVIDTSGYVPRNVLTVAETLKDHTARYLFMSTVSVYAGWPVDPLSEASSVLECPPDADGDFGEDVEDGPTKYGYQKSGCEAAVRVTFGDTRSTVLRPGVIIGPYEYVGRLPWWLRRVAADGRIIAPGDPSRTIQPVDVRDLAAFALRTCAGAETGTFNVTAPAGSATFGELLDACAEVTQTQPTFVWVPDETLARLGVRQWSEIPLWRVHAGVWSVDSSRAASAGLGCRPLIETVRDTWHWMLESDDLRQDERAAEIGLSPAGERRILAAVSGPPPPSAVEPPRYPTSTGP
jgi:2'-hydroxyisoflavone reductase